MTDYKEEFKRVVGRERYTLGQYSKKLYLDIPDDGDDEFKEDHIDMDYCLVCGMKL